jgi:uncharacterized protein Veg
MYNRGDWISVTETEGCSKHTSDLHTLICTYTSLFIIMGKSNRKHKNTIENKEKRVKILQDEDLELWYNAVKWSDL